MDTRSQHPAGQQTLYRPTPEDKAHLANHQRTTRLHISHIPETAAIRKGSAPRSEDEPEKAHVADNSSSRKSSSSQTSNYNHTTASSAHEAVTRKRPRTVEAEQGTVIGRTKRLRASVQQPSLAPQLEANDRRSDPTESMLQSSTKDTHKQTQLVSDAGNVDNPVNLEEESKADNDERDPILHWTRTFWWPKGYNQQDDAMNHLLAKQKSSGSLRRKRSAPDSFALPSIPPTTGTPSMTTPSDQKPRELKSIQYQNRRYEILLATKGSFMEPSELGINKASKAMYLELLGADQTVPSNSLFDDNVFEKTCRMNHARNEAKVIQDISRLIVPSAEALAAYGAKHAKILIESVNEGWNNSIPATGTRPQPDYSVGFKREAFSQEQLHKLAPFIGNFLHDDQSYFMATYYMYFPFLTCEVKCGAAALDIADRQNAHSMTLAVRAIVELFRLVGQEMDVHREILSFSFSHDDKSVRIFGHYPVINGKDTEYYRHAIHAVDFTVLDGKEKWTAYKFTKSLYETWMPTHFKRLCSAVDKLPAELDFSVSEISPSLGLPEDLQRRQLSGSGSQSQDHSQHSTGDARDTSPHTPITGQRVPNRPRKRQAGGA